MSTTDNDSIASESISTTSSERIIVTIGLTPLPGVDPVTAVRQGLKRLLRNHGLRCVSLSARGWPGTPQVFGAEGVRGVQKARGCDNETLAIGGKNSREIGPLGGQSKPHKGNQR